MRRILFEKTGNGIWISHLDLMRILQRAFRRSGILLKHTQGFNPHAFVSLALPLSVGTASRCELLDFELAESEAAVDTASLPERLNAALPDGIHCVLGYDGGRKLKELTHLQVEVRLEYDQGVPVGAVDAIDGLFHGETLVVEKRSKNGPVEQDILPMVKTITVSTEDENTVLLSAVICAQNPSLNPDLLAKAVSTHLSDFAPDFAKSMRIEMLTQDGTPFR